jgi:phosphoribosylformimino-5-aminoimidazole carboxamide ribotide isomerase
MRILPVLDIMEGQVVRGIAGRRNEYRPITSPLTRSSTPHDVAQAFRDHFGLTELYLADLDAIGGRPAALATYASLQAAGFTLWVDAGIREAADARPLVRAGIGSIVAGLETVAGPQTLEQLRREFAPQRIVFSLDLKNGVPLGRQDAWSTSAPYEIGRCAVACGAGCVLVLDLARVGMDAGTGTEDLCRQFVADFPHLEVAAGGGVRGPADLSRLKQAGVHVVLVASALHDGRLQQTDLLQL